MILVSLAHRKHRRLAYLQYGPAAPINANRPSIQIVGFRGVSAKQVNLAGFRAPRNDMNDGFGNARDFPTGKTKAKLQ
jgi:hypothetical protein